MDQEEIRQAALRLGALLSTYASNNGEARALKRALAGLLDQAQSGRITVPLRWENIPGSYVFMEGSLSDCPDLENAYARFRILVTDKEAFVAEVMKGMKP